MSDIEILISKLREFAQARDWEKFHTAKNLVMAISGEVGELAAEFQWLTDEQSKDLSGNKRENIELEIADVAIYLLRLCDVLQINLRDVIEKKIHINSERFPELK